MCVYARKKKIFCNDFELINDTDNNERAKRRVRAHATTRMFSIIILVYSIKKSLLICKHTRAIGVAFFALFVINC